jgi:serine O-acetyltransferase
MDKWLPELTRKLLESYESCGGGINHLNGINLPSKAGVEDLTQKLLQLLFPGFLSEEPLVPSDLPAIGKSWLKDTQKHLIREMSRSLEYRPVRGQTAETITEKFLESLVDLRRVLATDVAAAYEGDPAAASTDEVMLSYPGVEAIAVQRMAHLLYQQGVALIPRIMTEWAHERTGIDIHPGATIGMHFFIDHGTGVVIGETTVIGHHVRIYQGVTLGGKSVAKRIDRDEQGKALGGKRHPTIGDWVTIYANATILGGDTVIGENSIVGGNVWLTQSVPPHSIVSLESQQVSIRSKNPAAPDWDI